MEKLNFDIESLRECVVVADKVGNICLVNSATLDLLEYSFKDVRSLKLSQLFENSRKWKLFFIEIEKKKFVIGFESDFIKADGKLVNVVITADKRYDRNDLHCGYQVLFRDNADRKTRERNLIFMAYHDRLTGLYNRHRFLEIAKLEVSRSKRYERPLSLLMFDVDHFKSVNDTYGHGNGDLVLKGVVGSCKKGLRNFDVFSRYGGEEFVLLLPETDSRKALTVAERIRTHVESSSVRVGNAVINVTVSVGVSALSEELDNVEKLIEAADKALYLAKNSGRNNCKLEHE